MKEGRRIDRLIDWLIERFFWRGCENPAVPHLGAGLVARHRPFEAIVRAEEIRVAERRLDGGFVSHFLREALRRLRDKGSEEERGYGANKLELVEAGRGVVGFFEGG